VNKPLTSDQIETELSEIVDSIHRLFGAPVQTRATVDRHTRQAFTLGTDHGKAIILERAESLMGEQAINAEHAAAGRAFAQVMTWVAAVDGRQFCAVGQVGDKFCASVTITDDERDANDGFWTHGAYGATAHEALAVLAGWCAEHMAPLHMRDTMPAPPLPLASELPRENISEELEILF
jgi:hypothetical protein